MLEGLSVRIRRQETPAYRWLYRLAKASRQVEIPVIRPLHLTLYYERRGRLAGWGYLTRVLYYQPLFRARCENVGRNFILWQGIPVVMGHLRIRIGHNVQMFGTTTLVAARLARNPVLEIGDFSYTGYGVGITVGEKVTIGKHVRIANRVVIAGDDGHPLDPIARRTTPGSGTGSIVIDDDAWIGEAAVILKNVTIGEGAVVGAGAVVTGDVPPRCVVAGNPARVVKQL